MSAYVIVEFTVKDADIYREKYASNAGKTAKRPLSNPASRIRDFGGNLEELGDARLLQA
jgi:hypothetical protein